ncbi:MAG: YbbR-like domain-containing protein [Oscillospiraceae bacterium]
MAERAFNQNFNPETLRNLLENRLLPDHRTEPGKKICLPEESKMKEKFQWKKINLNKWLENKTFLWVMSLIIAVGVWGTIVYNLYPDTTKVIQGVPITINTQDTRIRQLGLNVISGNDTTVDVLVTARRYLIDSITADDIEVTALMNGVTAPGDATLELQATVKSSSNKEFTIERVTPRKVQVKFGRLVNKTFKVEVDFGRHHSGGLYHGDSDSQPLRSLSAGLRRRYQDQPCGCESGGGPGTHLNRTLKAEDCAVR